MASENFIDLGPIKGESTAEGHAGKHEIYMYEWGVQNKGSFGEEGTGGGTGRPTVSSMTIIKRFGAASPDIMAACTGGTKIKTAEIMQCKLQGKKLVDVIVFELGGVTISSYERTSSHGEVSDKISLDFETVKFKYRPLKDNGPGSWVTGGFSIEKNTKL